MKEQKRLDKVLNAAYLAVQDEVGALTGAEFSLSEPQYAFRSKEDAFDELTSRQVLAKIDITGDLEGEGCLLFGIKDAIRLGGILVMLPESELDKVIAGEEYTEDLEDSFGEIANIIVGAYSKSFEDLYPKACRCIRKEQEVVTPAKIDVESDQPVVDQLYYVATHQLTVNGTVSGDMVLLLPATTFSVAPEGAEDQSKEDEEKTDNDVEREQTEVTQEQDDAGQDSEPVNSTVVQYNPKNLPRIEKIVDESGDRVAEELSSLLGVEVTLGQLTKEFKTKEELFEDLPGKQVAAKMDIRGDIEGQGALFISLKGAIRIGGSLIMLPQSELEEVIKGETYNEETADSYGEVANIIAGSYTKVLEDSYPKNCRIIRKEQECITSVKIETDSDHFIPDQTYYVIAAELSVEGKSCGPLVMVLPADTFGILAPIDQQPAAPQEKMADGGSQDSDTVDQPSVKQEEAENKQKKIPSFDCEKHRARVDKLFELCRERMEEEVGAMLATKVAFTALENKLITKEDFFFEQVAGKQILSHMDVVGDDEGKAYFYAGLKDAIRIGGILIMLPPNELDAAVSEEDYSEDIADAYGEIANIIAGVYTGIFEEQYTKKWRFIRKESENVAPMKVAIDSDQPMPDQKYYLHSLQFRLDDKDLGQFHLAVPATLLQLDRLGETVEENDEVSGVSGLTDKEAGHQKTKPEETIAHASPTTGSASHDVIVIGNDETEKKKIIRVLEDKGLLVKELQLKDNVYNYVNEKIKVVFLVMQDVNEIGFGVSIKISSACSCPLIAAGTAWTRTKVIKAVKYGVADILLTPATDQDITDKLDNNAVKIAA